MHFAEQAYTSQCGDANVQQMCKRAHLRKDEAASIQARQLPKGQPAKGQPVARSANCAIEQTTKVHYADKLKQSNEKGNEFYATNPNTTPPHTQHHSTRLASASPQPLGPMSAFERRHTHNIQFA
jgi:hypothetical protein